MFFGCFPCARKKVLEHLFKVCYIINIETEERKTKTMKNIETKIANLLKFEAKAVAEYRYKSNFWESKTYQKKLMKHEGMIAEVQNSPEFIELCEKTRMNRFRNFGDVCC